MEAKRTPAYHGVLLRKRISNSIVAFVDENDFQVVHVLQPYGRKEQTAIASLIAVAPDMVELLEQCADMLSNVHSPERRNVTAQRARALLTNIKGEST